MEQKTYRCVKPFGGFEEGREYVGTTQPDGWVSFPDEDRMCTVVSQGFLSDHFEEA